MGQGVYPSGQILLDPAEQEKTKHFFIFKLVQFTRARYILDGGKTEKTFFFT